MSLRDKIQRGREALKAGATRIELPASTECFVTPPDVAARMVDYLDIPGDGSSSSVLEPSAGTGSLVDALWKAHPQAWLRAVERDRTLVDILEAKNVSVGWGDFLTEPFTLGSAKEFSHVLMNPPFSRGSDVKHVLHALETLEPGGTLVALVADGPRQAEAFSDWEDLERLPAGTFAGTQVRTRIVRTTKHS